ncbi:MAG TPA: aconitase X catalytic domain-containing protein [Actinomycetota bacterium]
MPGLNLDPGDRAMLEGAEGEAAALAMRLLTGVAEASAAESLLDVASAHIDGGLYHGQAGLDFAERLASLGARVRIPTTLNVGALDLLHPERYRGDAETAAKARRLMDLHVGMGCRPTWTCAPYQIAEVRPSFGEHVAWGESNAIVFANSVLGARTDRYGDFLDLCAAVTGRAPAAGLHLDRNRLGRTVFRLEGVSERLLDHDVLFPVLGHLVGMRTGPLVPVIEGLPGEVSEDRLKALGAAAASSGAVGMFHAVGTTPEAPTLEHATSGRPPESLQTIGPADLRTARDELSTVGGGRIGAVSLGTPHASLDQIGALATLMDGRTVAPDVEAYLSTGRDVLSTAAERGWLEALERAGVRVVTDTCTYVTPVIESRGPVMTDSAKWAYYAPGNLGVEVVFGSLEECVRSAASGRVERDDGLWG